VHGAPLHADLTMSARSRSSGKRAPIIVMENERAYSFSKQRFPQSSPIKTPREQYLNQGL
jgi:hypothetical protein